MYTSVFFKGIYTSGNSLTARLVRPNIQKKITEYSVHEMILCIYDIKYTRVFFKGIYTSVNSRTAGLFRPNIQKKIKDNSVHEMIICIYNVHECILQRNLYFRELTYRKTGSPEHPKENNRL